MAKTDKEFLIPFVGLKIGIHEFKFEITDAFFDKVEYSLIDKGNVEVTLALEKKETMMIGDYVIKGKVETSCDLCNDPVSVDVQGEYQLIYKFDDQPSDDESLIIVYPDEYELNVRENILELISVSLPTRSIHEDGECNEEMMEILDQYRVNADDVEYDDYEADEVEEDEDVDPRWAALKNLKKDD